MEKTNFYCMRYYVTYRCNSRCSYCNVWKSEIFKNIRELSLEEAKKLISQCYDIGIRYIDFTGGEPTLYPYLSEVIKYAKELGIKTEVTSNCISEKSKAKMLEIAANADKFNTSLDTLNKEAYKTIRGVDCCENVKLTVSEIARIRSPKIMTVVTKDNIKELDSMIRYAQMNKSLIYLSPMFPYVDKDGKYKVSEYIPYIIRQILKPYTVVLLHFMEFFRTSTPERLPPCSANQYTLTIAPNGNIVLPCYHAIKEEIVWDGNLEGIIQSEKFQKYIQESGQLKECRGCSVIPYFGISFNYQLNKYFLLQSFSEKLYHLKRDGLNSILENLNIDENRLLAQIEELMEIASSLTYKADMKAYKIKDKHLYPAVIEDEQVITPVYKKALSIGEYETEKTAKDCWQLKFVPHYYYDKFIHNIIVPMIKEGKKSKEEMKILKDIIEYQIRWWKFYIIEYFKLDSEFENKEDKEWINRYLNQVDKWTGYKYSEIIEEGLFQIQR